MLPEKLLGVDVFSAVHFQMPTATTTDHEAAGRVPEVISMIVLAWRGRKIASYNCGPEGKNFGQMPSVARADHGMR
jgi:hypothetical protein